MGVPTTTVSHRIRTRLKKQRLTQADLAKAMGVSRTKVNQLLNRRTEWTSGLLVTAARVLSISLEELVAGTEFEGLQVDVASGSDPDVAKLVEATSELRAEIAAQDIELRALRDEAERIDDLRRDLERTRQELASEKARSAEFQRQLGVAVHRITKLRQELGKAQQVARDRGALIGLGTGAAALMGLAALFTSEDEDV